MTDIGPSAYSFAEAINNRGQVVGITESPPEDTDPYVPLSGMPTHVFLWESGHLSDLPIKGLCRPVDDFGCEYRDPTVNGINERGHVIGVDGAGRGFLWRRGVVQDLGSFHPTAINDRGQVAGGDQLWENGAIIDFGLPSLCLGIQCYHPLAADINEQGQVVGAYPFGVTEGPHPRVLYHGFLWSRTRDHGGDDDSDDESDHDSDDGSDHDSDD